MLNLPEKYTNSIISMFGTMGEEWLANINKIVDKYVEKFNLTNVSLHEDLKINLVLYAECKELGNVVLKIGLPVFDELILRETAALEIFNGIGACKCFYNNREDGVRILERLIPGEELHITENREERIKEFCDVALKLNVKMAEHIQLPTYREILDRSIDQSNEQPEKYLLLKEFINIADILYREIESFNLPKYLLHADLQHSNILTSNGDRKAIDPHGFIGEKILETARFMEHEIPKKEISKANILEIIELMAKYFGDDKKLICKALFIDYVLSTCWDIETNFADEHIRNDIYNLKIVLDCLINDLSIGEKENSKDFNENHYNMLEAVLNGTVSALENTASGAKELLENGSLKATKDLSNVELSRITGNLDTIIIPIELEQKPITLSKKPN